MSPLRALFSTEIYLPRGHGYFWTPKLLILEGGSNVVMAMAAVAIGWRLVRPGRPAGTTSIAPRATAWLAAFAIFVAATHFFDVWLIWAPLYWLDALVRSVAAVVAVVAALRLWSAH